jgi:hypothetical protein
MKPGMKATVKNRVVCFVSVFSLPKQITRRKWADGYCDLPKDRFSKTKPCFLP